MHKVNYLAVAINKGGTGKSHTTFNLAATWGAGLAPVGSKRKPKILVVDLDPQANSSNLFINSAREIEDDPFTGLRDMREKIEENGFMMAYDLIRKTDDPNDLTFLDQPIFKPNPGMMDVSVLVAKGTDATVYHQVALESPMEVAERLSFRLDALAYEHKFDLVIIDTPPGETNKEMLATLHVATDLIIPATLDAHGKEGLATMRDILEAIQEVRVEAGDKLKLAGIVLNLLSPQSSSDRDFMGYIDSQFPSFSSFILKTGLSYFKTWKVQSSHGLPSWYASKHLKPASRKVITESMKSLAKEINSRLSEGVVFEDETEQEVV